MAATVGRVWQGKSGDGRHGRWSLGKASWGSDNWEIEWQLVLKGTQISETRTYDQLCWRNVGSVGRC